MANLNKAIQDLAAAGTLRKDIKSLLGCTAADIQALLGKDGRGRKAKDNVVIKEQVTIVDVISIDQSGSMEFVADETANGVNTYLKDMKKKAKETGITSFAGVNTFDAGWGRCRENVIVETPITDVSKLKPNFKGIAGGSTPLNDGLAKAIEMTQEFIADNNISNPDVTITVFTDGGENSSKIKLGQVTKMVREAKELGWTIAFVGPHGSKHYADSLSIENVLEYDHTDVGAHVHTHSVMSMARSAKSDDISVGKFSNTSYFVEN